MADDDNVDYGVDAANTRFTAVTTLASHEHNYLALRDHIGPSGVPLGGIGVGCFDLAPDGRFTRIALNNTHRVMGPDGGRGCFFSLWQNDQGNVLARRLARDRDTRYGMKGYEHTTYRGLFPTARISFEAGAVTPAPGVLASVYAWSGFVPQDVKNSSLPATWFEVTLVNATVNHTVDAAVAFAWEDFIGRGIVGPRSLDELSPELFAMQSDHWPQIPRVPTAVEPYARGDWAGLRQYATQPIRPIKMTFQNHIHEFAVLAESQGATVTMLPAFAVEGGDEAWKSFRETGAFDNASGGKLSDADSAPMASAIAIKKAGLVAGAKYTFCFMVVWHMPPMPIDRAKADPRSFFGTGNYDRYYHNFFPSLADVADHAISRRKEIHGKTVEWHEPILRATMPDWLKFKLINSAYTLYTNGMLNKAGEFTVMEGSMGGLAGTMDQRLSAHPLYQKFFTQLDRSEMQMFADCQDASGYILHFIGDYYKGMAHDGAAPTPGSWMLDNAGAWIVQLAKDYAQTGDLDYLQRNALGIRKAMAWLRTRIRDGSGIPVGPTTYDDYTHPPVYSFMAGVYLAVLRAGAAIGEALGDGPMVRECKEQFKVAQKGWIDAMWNGRYFAYGCDVGGTNRRDDLLFGGQLGGQFISRYCAWGDIVPLEMVRASLISQFKLALSQTPDYYANKVWDVELMRGVDMPGSQCWPFYLESYVAMAAIQAGFVADGLDIMKHIQLVHLRNGWTWCQNLWNPGEVTYMTAPVTWFIPDVLAGASLDVPRRTLYLAPILQEGQDRLRLPLFFPRFWAELEADRASRSLGLRIIKTFGERSIRLDTLVCQPAGRPTSEADRMDIGPFEVRDGAELDLSPHWDRLCRSRCCQPILPRAGEVDFLFVPKP